MPSTVILGTARTPFGKMGGTLSSLDATDLGGHVIEAALERSGVGPEQVQQVVFGQVLQAGQGQIPSRQAQIKAGETDAAAASLDRLSEDDEAAPLYRQLGELLALQREFDGAAAGALSDRLTDLTRAGAPWRYSALELEALAQLRAGETEAARRTLETLLSDPLTPPQLGRRAAELMASLGGPLETAEDAAPAQGTE